MATFWARALEQDWGKLHPMAESDLAQVFGIVVHVDGFEIYSNSEFIAWTWSSIHSAGGGDSWDTKFPILLVPHARLKSKAAKRRVMSRVAHFIGWMVEVLMSGFMPMKGYYGEDFDSKSARYAARGAEIADGFQGAFVGFKADRKARRESHFFARRYGSTFICEGCCACAGFKKGPPNLRFGDCTEGAGWRATHITHEAYLLLEQDCQKYVKT